jgi:HAE1 family hydrophobic/amphiphilic exporter-1
LTVPEFSVRQVVLVNILFVVCLLAGVVAYLRTPVDFLPRIEFNSAIVFTTWTGASADEVERLVTTRIEEELVDIDGVDEMRSVSRSGVSQIFIQFDQDLSDLEYQASMNDLRTAVDRVNDLPEDAENPVIEELDTKTIYTDIRVAVVDAGGLGEIPLHEVTQDVQARLADVPGIEKVSLRGKHDREVRVLVDRDAAARHGLTAVEIAARIGRENLNLPAGSFVGPEGESTLRATGDFDSIGDLLGTVIRESATGTHLRLSDVARIEEGVEKRRTYVRYNGKPALVLGVAKAGDSDVLEVSKAIDAFIAKQAVPEGIELHKTWDTSEWVEARIGVLSDNLKTGVALVMMILWFTIGFRNAALTIIAIPFSFLAALILFPVFGITINAMSLIGMLLVSGMLVDDAIIVLENIYRKIEEGHELQRAIIEGAQEVMWPVIAAVGTTIAAFAPLLLLGGIAGKFMSILPITVIVCLAASLFECLVILPAHYLDFGSRGRGETPPEPGEVRGIRGALLWIAWRGARLRTQIDARIERLRAAYLRGLDVVLAAPGSFLGLAAALFLLALGLGSHMRVDLFPAEWTNFFVTLEMPTDWGLDRTAEVVDGVEGEMAALLGDPIEDWFTTVGNTIAGADDNRAAPNLAVSFAWVVDSERYRTDPEQALAVTRERLEAYAAAHEEIVDLQVKPPRNGPPIGRPVAVRITSDDWDVNKSIALEMQAYLRSIPGVSNIEDNLREGQREVRLVVDSDRAVRHGLTFQDLATSLRAANDGLVASQLRPPDQEDEIDIRVMLAERYRRSLDDLLQTEVRTPAGYLVKLGDVAQVEMARGVVEYWHFDRERAVTVYADVDGHLATALGVNQSVAAEFADVPVRRPDVSLWFGGEAESTRETVDAMMAAFPIALVLIYGILAAVFRSYLQPLVVATAIPFGLIGVVLGTGALGYTVSMSMMYGTVGLTGVVVNDSLVMVDFINRARARGVPLLEAVRQSGAQRLRPILLTTMTTVLALMPMALGLHGGSASFGPFAASITFGLLFAMIGTLFIVPLSYTQLIRSQAWLRTQFDEWRAGTGASALR